MKNDNNSHYDYKGPLPGHVGAKHGYPTPYDEREGIRAKKAFIKGLQARRDQVAKDGPGVHFFAGSEDLQENHRQHLLYLDKRIQDEKNKLY